MGKLSTLYFSDIITSQWEVVLFAQNCCAMWSVLVSILNDSKNSWFHSPNKVWLPGSERNNSLTPQDAAQLTTNLDRQNSQLGKNTKFIQLWRACTAHIPPLVFLNNTVYCVTFSSKYTWKQVDQLYLACNVARWTYSTKTENLSKL